MSAGFGAVQWNRAKLVYDSILLASVTFYITSYLTVVYWLGPPNDQLSAIDLRIRAFGSCAFFMLTMFYFCLSLLVMLVKKPVSVAAGGDAH